MAAANVLSMTSDEESFVILGSTPTPSINGQIDSFIRSQRSASASESGSQPVSVSALSNGVHSLAEDALTESDREAAALSASFRIPMNLAEDAALLKSSIVESFPSLYSPTSSSSPEDLRKLDSLVCEHLEMKANLEKTNIAMRQHFEMISGWQDNLKRFKEAKKRETDVQADEIKKLKEEIVSLNKELIDKSEHCEMTRALANQENTELVQRVSHQQSIIMNLTNQIASFELQSFEMLNAKSLLPVQKSSPEPEPVAVLPSVNAISELKREECRASLANISKRLKNAHSELEALVIQQKSTTEEHEKIVGDLNEQLGSLLAKNREIESMRHAYGEQSARVTDMQLIVHTVNGQLSSLLAENLEIQDMKSLYVDEIQCLKENLSAAETELKRHKDLAVDAATKDETIAALRSEVDILKGQLDVYRDDFEIERKSRQDMASEREEILADLKLLQRRNAELMKERSSTLSASSASVQSTSSASDSSWVRFPSGQPAAVSQGAESSSGPFACPICNKKFVKMSMVEGHVDDCLSRHP